MQTSVAMTAFTSLNKFMRREVWHLADGPELNNVQQTSRASTLILITEQTTWLQSDALMKTFTSFPGFIPPPPPPKSSDLRERNICIVFVSKEHERFAESVSLSIDYYRLNLPRNSLYSIRCLRWEILQEKREFKKESTGRSRMFDDTNAINPTLLYTFPAWSILHQEEVKSPEETTTCVVVVLLSRGSEIVIPTRLGHVKWARILSTYGRATRRDFRLLSLQGLAWISQVLPLAPLRQLHSNLRLELRVVRRIRRDKCWTIGEFVLSLKVSSGKIGVLGNRGRHVVLMYVLYFSSNEDILSPRSHGKKSRSFLLDEVVYDWRERPVLYIYIYITQAIFRRSCSFDIEIKGRTFFRFHRF